MNVLCTKHALTLLLVGNDQSYGAKLAWQNLRWNPTTTTVEVGHHRHGPDLTIKCRGFNARSQDELDVFWKSKEGWRAVRTSAFGLEEPSQSLDNYVSQCTALYLQSDIGGYIGLVTRSAGAKSNVGRSHPICSFPGLIDGFRIILSNSLLAYGPPLVS
jgi:hypothetical protein